MLVMATSKIEHTHRRSDEQPPRVNRDHETAQQTKPDASTADTAVRAVQRYADAGIRHAKQHTRYRNREFAAARRTDTDDRAGPGTGDRRGKVA